MQDNPLLKEWKKGALLAAQDWKALKLRRPLNVAVVGSRTTTPDMVQAVHRLIDGMPESFAIISGGAKGVDTIAQIRAEGRGMFVKVFKPEWKRHGRRAGMLRNRVIIASADVVFAFWDGESPGTQNSINLSHELSKPVVVQEFNEGRLHKPSLKKEEYKPQTYPPLYMHPKGAHKKRAGD